jgi:outer membrane protein assembly factor BamB
VGRVLAMLLALAAAARGDDWPRWRGPSGDGISRESDWKPESLRTPRILWKAAVGEGHSAPSISEGRLYILGNQGGKDVVACLDALSGKDVWRYGVPCTAGNYAGPRASAVVDGGLVYTLHRDGQVFCFDAAKGDLKWKKHLGTEHKAVAGMWGFSGSPLVVGDALWFNARASGLALDKKSGAKLLESNGGQCGYASPLLFGEPGKERLAIFGMSDLVLVDPATAKPQGSIPWKTEFDVNAADPVHFDGKLFITSGYEKGCALLDVSGPRPKVLWENQNLRGHFASPVVLDGHLYGIDGNTSNGQLRCLDAKTGKVAWTQRGGIENLAAAGGRLLTIDKKGVLAVVAADPAAYKELARAQVLSGKGKNWTAPVLANGLIYCRNSEGELSCVDAR